MHFAESPRLFWGFRKIKDCVLHAITFTSSVWLSMLTCDTRC